MSCKKRMVVIYILEGKTLRPGGTFFVIKVELGIGKIKPCAGRLGPYAYARLSRTLMRVAPRAGKMDARIEISMTIPSQIRTADQL